MANNIGIYDFPRELIDFNTLRQPIDDAPPKLTIEKMEKGEKMGETLRKLRNVGRKQNWREK